MASRHLFKVLHCSNYSPKAGVPAFICQRRSFTNSNARRKHGAVPAFTEISSPELEDLLLTMRNTVFLPANLSKSHRNLIYGTRNRTYLQDEPVEVEVGGEVFRLQYIDRTKDQPGTVESLIKLLSLMKDKKDWAHLPNFLEGLNDAGRKLKSQHLEMMVRKAGQAGQLQIIIECARRASHTGFVLKDLELVREVTWWIQNQALLAGWTAQSTKEALCLAEQVADLLEDKKHCGGRLLNASDPRARPEVAGVLLQLAAAHAKLSTGKDEDGKVQIYSKRLLGTLSRKFNLSESLPASRDVWLSNAILRYVTPIIYGMREAVEILGPESETAKQLKERQIALAAMANHEYEKIMAEESSENASKRLGVWNYNMLIKLSEG